MKTLVYGIILVLLLLASYYLYTDYGKDILVPAPIVSTNENENDSTINGVGSTSEPLILPGEGNVGTSTTDIVTEGKKKQSVTFSGKLEEVNTGCFADGECYVVVDGKKITVLRGWSQDIVGKLLGVESIGDLEEYIGKSATVFALKTPENTYTLYGSSEYYIQVNPTEGVSLSLQEAKRYGELTIYLEEVIEDSRCPSDVNCIQAGTVRVRGSVTKEGEALSRTFVLNDPVTVFGITFILTDVTPYTNTKINIKNKDYKFLFKISE